MMYEKPYKVRLGAPPVSIYLTSDDTVELAELKCLWDGRTIADIRAGIDKIISTPMPLQAFEVAINIRCKLCRQDYRLLF
jgi:hypothetical protein